MRIKNYLIVAIGCTLLCSCAPSMRLTTYGIDYMSLRQIDPKDPAENTDAKIKVAYHVDSYGNVTGYVYNNTDEIMILDQTKSFFVNSDGSSTSYFDPTVRTSTTTDLSSGTKGASVNLGAVGNALGVGGSMGTLLNGVNVGGSSTNGQAVSNTTYIADMPSVSIGPHGSGALSKSFKVNAIKDFCTRSNWSGPRNESYELNPSISPIKFSIILSYSVDGGNTFEKIRTEFYVNSRVAISVDEPGQLNKALRTLYNVKPDALYETWYRGNFINNRNGEINNFSNGGYYIDHK